MITVRNVLEIVLEDLVMFYKAIEFDRIIWNAYLYMNQ